jgi:hypothetical protein
MYREQDLQCRPQKSEEQCERTALVETRFEHCSLSFLRCIYPKTREALDETLYAPLNLIVRCEK